MSRSIRLATPTSRAWSAGLGCRSGVREFLYGPDDLQQLRVGEAILIENNPHRVQRVQVVDALSAADLMAEGLTIDDLNELARTSRASCIASQDRPPRFAA